MHRHRLVTATVLAAATVTTVSGCGAVSDRLGGTAAHEGARVAARPVLRTTDWGVVDGLVSVIVENTSDRTLRYAEAVVVARDGAGHDVATPLATAGVGGRSASAACCTISELGPGQSYGVYVDVGPNAARVRDVDVRFRNLSWSPADQESDVAGVRARGLLVRDDPTGAVVEATIETPRPVAQLGVQALLDGPDGRFLAVVSGRWTCRPAGTSRIRMQLFHPVPRGTRIRTVSVHAADGDPSRTPPTCPGSR